MPSGALGIWYADQMDATTKAIPNSLGSGTLSPSILRGPARGIGVASKFGNTLSNAGFTITRNRTDSQGGTNAIQLQASAAADLRRISLTNLPAGTYTIVVKCKSNTGGSVPFKIGTGSAGSQTVNALTTWSRVAASFACSAGDYIQPVQWASGTLDMDVESVDMYPGSSDLGGTVLDTNLYLGLTPYSGAGTLTGASLDLSGGGYGIVSFPTAQSLTTFTLVTLAQRQSSAISNYSSAMAADPTTFADLVAGLDQDTFAGAYEPYAEPKAAFGGGGLYNPASQQGLWTLYGQGWHAHTHRYDGTKLDHFLDDARIHSQTYTATTPVSISDLLVNNTQNQIGYYAFHAWALFPRALSDAEVRQAVAYLQSRAAGKSITASSVGRVYCAVGDSITQGYNAATTYNAYPNRFGPNASPAVVGHNYGFSGYTLANLVANAPTVDATLPTAIGSRKFILSVLIGANDLYNYTGASDAAAAANYLAALAAYCDARRAAGWKVVVCTILPRSDTGITAGQITAHNARRAIVNAAITSSWVGVHCDAAADFAGNANMGPDSASDNATYYTDKLHPTDAGHIALEAVIRPVINSI